MSHHLLYMDLIGPFRIPEYLDTRICLQSFLLFDLGIALCYHWWLLRTSTPVV